MAHETRPGVIAVPDALSKIPPFPPVAARIIESLSDENTHLKELVDLIRSDPKLSVQLLQRANSAVYGFASRISSVQDALLLLGLETVKALALTLATGKYTKVARQIPELHRCWRHILATALLAEELAQAASVPRDQAYTAGLLHDIGRLGLLVVHPTEYAELLRSADEDRQKDDSTYLLDLERQRFGVDHCEAGRWLAEHWGLPKQLGAVAGRHHDRPYGGQTDLLEIVQLSCRFADTLGYDVIHTSRPFTFEMLRGSFPDSMRNRLGTQQDVLERTIANKIYALDPDAGPDFTEDLAENEESEDVQTEDLDISTAKPNNKVADTRNATARSSSFRVELVMVTILGVLFAAALLLFLVR